MGEKSSSKKEGEKKKTTDSITSIAFCVTQKPQVKEKRNRKRL